VHDAVTTPPRLENEAVTGAGGAAGADSTTGVEPGSSAPLDEACSAVELDAAAAAPAGATVVDGAVGAVVDVDPEAATGATRSAVPVSTEDTANHASPTAAAVQANHVSGISDRLATPWRVGARRLRAR
jgi:hypothetical protein